MPPFASFDWFPKVPTVGQTIAFVSTSFDPDPDGNITNAHWTFGDGVEENGDAIEHAYSTSGEKHVLLEVIDDGGEGNSTSASVLIAERILNITANSLVNILVQDPNGDLTGYEIATGHMLLDIEGSFYTGPSSHPQNIQIPNPVTGQYRICMHARGFANSDTHTDTHTDVARHSVLPT